MSCVIDSGDGYWQLYSNSWPVAKKQHKCCECGSDIDPGEKYRRISGLWEGEFLTYKQCEICADIFDETNNELGSWYSLGLGCLWEHLGL